MPGFSSTHEDRIGHGRRGVIQTAHGDVETPAFFPVLNLIGGPTTKSGGIWSRARNRLFDDEAFQGAMFQAMSFLDFNAQPDQLEKWREQTLHDHYTDHPPVKPHHQQPADFTQPLFVDSGGFKLMNSDTFGEAPTAGGSENDWGIYTNPESILDLQLDYGADIIATLDYPIPPNLNEQETNQRMEASIDSAIRCLELLEDHDDPPAVYVAIHGHDYETINWYVGTFLDRSRHIEKSFEGFAIGSLVPLRTNVKTLVDIVQGAKHAIPDSRADNLGLHVFGIGGQFCSLLALLGVDSFDSSSYVQAAKFKKFINKEIRPDEFDQNVDDVDAAENPFAARATDWSKFTADELPDGWACACPACQTLHSVGYDQMETTLYESTSYDQSGEYMKSDFYALIAHHNFHVYQEELTYVRQLIDEGEGALLKYVAELAENGVGKIRNALDRAQRRDSELTRHLYEMGYRSLIPYKQQTLNTNVVIEEDGGSKESISLAYTPDDFDILQQPDYQPPSRPVLLVLPCSQRKPYSESRTHRVVEEKISDLSNEIHKVTLSGMYGPVPEEFEDQGPVKSYEYVLTNADTDRQNLIIERLTTYLEEFGDQYNAVIGYATSKTYRETIKQAFNRYGEGEVLPENPEMRSLTEHFREENLDELTEKVRIAISAAQSSNR